VQQVIGANKVLFKLFEAFAVNFTHKMREIVHLQAGQCGNQIGAKVRLSKYSYFAR